MKTSLSLLVLGLLGGAAHGATTQIAPVPLLNIVGTGAVKPNLMLLYDNSGSMANNFTPDYIDDSTTCRAGSTMLSFTPTGASKSRSGTTGCLIGHPPFASPDFNKQYYNPKVRYLPPVRSDGTSYNSMTAANTSNWTSVTTDGFGVNTKTLNNVDDTDTNLVTGFPDLKWCDINTANCQRNTAAYPYPTNTNYVAQAVSTNPYYYTIRTAEYCADANLKSCVTTTVGASAPTGYPFPAPVRWCDSTSLSTTSPNSCQAKYMGNFKYPRFSSPNAGQIAAYGTVTIGASANTASLRIDSVSVTSGSPAATVQITNAAVTAASGTTDATKQAALAYSLAGSIVASTAASLSKEYTACVRTPSGGAVLACSAYGITLSADNIVAVIPVSCTATSSTKSLAVCAVSTDASRAGAISVSAAGNPAVPADLSTALLKITANVGNSNGSLGNLQFGGVNMFSGSLSFTKNTTAANLAIAIRDKINANSGGHSTITAYVGPNAISSVCASATASMVCLVDSATTATAKSLTLVTANNMPSNTLVSSVAWKAPVGADAISTTNSPLGTGDSVFVRNEIVSTRTSYPKDEGRTDCAGASTCTYAEEMTNFANWYAYYKTRNQMMKTSVGQAFQPLNENYRVGLVALSAAVAKANSIYNHDSSTASTKPAIITDAVAQSQVTFPAPFSGTDRGTWYTNLYAMNGNQSTPLRAALHAVGQIFANQAPFVRPAGSEVVQYPCQPNFTFMTTDGYWNGLSAADVVNNDNADSPARFCRLSTGCTDPATQSKNSLADVSLYWYNGGSNTGSTSLRPDLENMSAAQGLVPAGPGENTRLHMVTYTLGLGVDGLMNYEREYDTKPKEGGDFKRLVNRETTGCPWNNNGAFVWPDPVTNTGETDSSAYQSRVDDLWHTAINGHGKYFAAADPTQVIYGLKNALNKIQSQVGAAAAAATSTPNISLQDNDIYADTFTTVKWYGVLSDKKVDTVTGIVSTDAVWNTSDKLGKLVDLDSDTRVIKMLAADGTLKNFKFTEMTSTEKAWFANKCSAATSPLTQCAVMSTANKAIIDNGATIVNWLRGQQRYADDAMLRAYTQSTVPAGSTTPAVPIVLGDIASAKPAFLREPRKGYTLTGYTTYKTDKLHRRPTVFVAANDGMLHAINAGTVAGEAGDTAYIDHLTYEPGQEMWAYAPRITMSKLTAQASTTYGTNHQFTVDGSPEVADVQIGGVWKTVLVGGLNAGGRGYYALDVTDPTNPVALWEICADNALCGNSDYADLGLSFGNPQFGMWKESATAAPVWVVFVTSGYNNVPAIDGVNSGDGKGYLYVIEVGTGRRLARYTTGAGDTTTPSGLAKITAISSNPQTDPLITNIYGGDNQGQMWRFDLTSPGSVRVVKMADAGALQPITSRPDVAICRVGDQPQVVVAFGTGRMLGVSDVSSTSLQSIYVLKDTGTGIAAADWRDTTKMAQRSLVALPQDASQYTVGGTTVDFSVHKGWWLDLDKNSGERVNLDPKIVLGSLIAVTNVPGTDSACSVGGTSKAYQLDLCTGKAVDTVQVDTDATTHAPILADIAGKTLSNSSGAVGFIIVRLPSGQIKMITTTADGKTKTTGPAPGGDADAQKAGWRRVRE
ncbi:MAG: PilC/PilY family type IV pilus protein [Massilia sp.]